MSETTADLTALAHEIAYCTSRSDIECHATADGPITESGWWWRTDQVAKDDQPWVERALRYLDARGLLERDPNNPNRVRIANA